MMDKPKSLYVHIPFCRHFCAYCDFPKVLLSTGFSKKYTTALIEEDKRYVGLSFDTIYLGGGTPSCIQREELKYLLNELVLRHGQPKEFTIECNPEDVDDSFVKLIKECGINRVSLGAQSTDDNLLKDLGRTHRFSDVIRSVKTLQSNGINNVSLDFIYGFEGQKIDDIDNDIDNVIALNIPHVSFYSLQIEPNTIFAIKHKNEPDGDLLADYYEHIVKRLEKAGLYRYEISNFAKPSYESKHNLCYWLSNPYGAIGMGATSFEDNTRITRTRSIEKYLNGQYYWKDEKEDSHDLEFDFLMLNLRLTRGFKLDEFKKRFGKDFLVAYKDKIDLLKDEFIIQDKTVKVKPEKLYVLDSILVDLLNF